MKKVLISVLLLLMFSCKKQEMIPYKPAVAVRAYQVEQIRQEIKNKATSPYFSVTLISGSIVFDAFRINFGEDSVIYSNTINEFDANKILNPNENIGIWKEGQDIAWEFKQPSQQFDTTQIKFSHLRPISYQLIVRSENIAKGKNYVFLDDVYGQKRVAINTTDTLDFSISIPYNQLRLKVVYK